ncbi:MAG: xanthine dehydrogenase family protein molybdopterin-binding subunit [Gammaproteobacteria bacterium]|jgi:isoquinoline 1-oxidoreductase subunit beta|nr:xanthine dehydrogenase family protein molybdopterin-binding subunit [Gammaproteobacteria bacterium]
MNLQKVNRREFLKATGMTAGGLVMGVTVPMSLHAEEGETGFHPKVFIQIAENGDTTLYCGRAEMGQGISTALPAAVADELEADWSRVTVLQGDGDKKYGSQATGGSRSINEFFIPMRTAGAAMREMLIKAASQSWGIPESDCYAELHFVHNKKNKKKLSYGELSSVAAKLPVPTKPALKSKDQFRYIGKPLTRHDQDEVVVGKRTYGIDTKIPGLKYAAITHVPVYGGKLKSVDKTGALKMKGVVDVVEVERIKSPFSSLGGVAVVADNTWTAQQALKKLKIEWDLGEHKGYDSKTYLQDLIKNVESPAEKIFSRGDVDKGLEEAATRHSASYTGGHLSHSPMEPMASLAWVQDDSCEIWASTQNPQQIQQVIAIFLGRKEEDIVVHVTAAGGAFGRKGKCDYVHEAAAISKAVGVPVQLTWSREEDMRTGYYHSINAQHLEAGLDKDGNISAWLQRAAFPSIGSTFNPSLDRANERDFTRPIAHPYGIANYKLESGHAPAHTRIGWYRAVYDIFYGFATNVFTDELAQKAGIDTLTFLRNIYDNNKDPVLAKSASRCRGVLDLAAKKGSWGKKMPKNHGLGIAVHYSYNSYLAMLVHVETKGDDIKVHRVDCAVDCGLVLNPDIATAQMEGAVVMGLSLSLREDVTFRDGAVVNSNYHDYPVLRHNEMPEVHVHFVDNDESPTGLGEPGVPTFAPAFINAIYAASGKRYRSIPIKPMSV